MRRSTRHSRRRAPHFSFRAVIAFVNDKQVAHSFESLTSTEKIVLLANDCSYRLLRGGLTAPLLNPGLEWRNAMLSALSEIGAADVERILRAGADLFDTVPEHEAGTYGDFIELAGEDCLFEYIVRHREIFRSE